MQDIATLLDQTDTTIALVGATENPAKFGCTIFRDLTRKGFTVYPINPNREKVGGVQAFPRLANLPAKPTIVNFVVPPEITLQVLAECRELELMNVWIQPGAEDPHVMAFLQEHRFNYLANACIMVESRLKA